MTAANALNLLLATEAAQATWTPEDYNLLVDERQLSQEEQELFELFA